MSAQESNFTLAEKLGYEFPREGSSCRVALFGKNKCDVPKISFSMCFAWYHLNASKETDRQSMREIFVSNLHNALDEYDSECGIQR